MAISLVMICLGVQNDYAFLDTHVHIFKPSESAGL